VIKKYYTQILLFVLLSLQLAGQNIQWLHGVRSSINDGVLDSAGNYYTCGGFDGLVDFDPGPGTFFLNAGNFGSAVVVKVDAAGNFVWAKMFATNGVSNAATISLDQQGFIYVGGSWSGTIDFDPGVGTNTRSSVPISIPDAFLLKLDNSGNLLWVDVIRGNGSEMITSLSLDLNQNVYVTGFFHDTTDFDPGPLVSIQVSKGLRDIFVAKYRSNGQYCWSTAVGSAGQDDTPKDIVCSGSNFCVTGIFSDTIDFDPSPATYTLDGISRRNTFAWNLDTSGAFNWVRVLRGLPDDAILSNKIASDVNGNFFISGFFTGIIDFDPGSSVFNLISTPTPTPFVPYVDGYIWKLDAAGNFGYAKQLTGSLYCEVFGISLDKAGNLYATGHFANTVDFDSGPGSYTLSSTIPNAATLFFLKYNTAGNFVYARVMGGQNSTGGYGIDVDSIGTVYGYGSYLVPNVFSSGTSNYTLTGNPGNYRLKMSCAPSVTGAISTSTLFCGNSVVNLSVSPGIEVSNYAWASVGAATIIGGQGSNSISIASSTTPFTVVVTPSNSCGAGNTLSLVMIPVPSIPNFTGSIIGPTSVCDGAVVQFSVTAAPSASSYSWVSATGGTLVNSTSRTFSLSLANSLFTLSVRPQNICGVGATLSKTVQVNPFPNLSLFASPSPTVCQGQTLTLTAIGASAFYWETGVQNGASFIPTISGQYGVYGTSLNCTSYSVINISVLPKPIISVSALPSHSVCQGGTVMISASGASGYSSTTATLGQPYVPLVTQNHTISGIGSNGCTGTGTIQVIVRPLPQLTVTAVPSNTVCLNSGVSLFGSGANSYFWSGGITNAISFTPNISGSYTLTGTNQFSCSSNTVVAVVVNQLPSLTITALPSVSVCQTESMVLTARGANSYSWNNGISNATGFFPSASGQYSVYATNSLNCSSWATINITVFPKPTISVSILPSLSVCPGSSMIVIASGAANFTSSTGAILSQSFIPQFSQSHSITAMDANGCSENGTFQVTVYPAPFLSVAAFPSFSICQNSAITLSATGASSFFWTGGIGNGVAFTPSITSTFTVLGVNQFSCEADTVVSIVLHPLPKLGLTILPSDSVCFGTSITMSATGAQQYQWNAGIVNGVLFTPSVSSNYTVSGTSQNGCVKDTSVLVVVHLLPDIGFSVTPSQTVCEGTSVTLSGTGGSQYHWSGGVVNGQAFQSFFTTNYTVTGFDANLCSNTISILIVAKPLPVFVSQPPSTTVTVGTGTVIGISCSPSSANYQWQLNSGSGFINISANGQYASTNTPSLILNFVTAAQDGYLFRCLAEFDNCSSISDSAILKVLDFTYLKNHEGIGSIKVYPVPAYNELTVELNGEQLDVAYNISSELGITLQEGFLYKNKNKLNLFDLKPGLYFLSIKSMGFVCRIVKVL